MAIAQNTTELHGDRPGSPGGMKVDVDPGVPLPPRPAAPPGVCDGAAS